MFPICAFATHCLTALFIVPEFLILGLHLLGFPNAHDRFHSTWIHLVDIPEIGMHGKPVLETWCRLSMIRRNCLRMILGDRTKKKSFVWASGSPVAQRYPFSPIQLSHRNRRNRGRYFWCNQAFKFTESSSFEDGSLPVCKLQFVSHGTVSGHGGWSVVPHI